MMRNLAIAMLIAMTWAGSALAVPESVSVRVTDVTTSSFALIWMTDVAAIPDVEVYSDVAMANRLSDGITVTAMPDVSQDVAAAARSKGIMKVRVAGLSPNTNYYVRAVTADPAALQSIGYSGVQQVTTATEVVPYRQGTDGSLQGFSNDIISMKVYLRPSDNEVPPGQGDLILLETSPSTYPISAFIGAGVAAPYGILDLNNLFGTDKISMGIFGGEKTLVSIYRGGALSTLSHYRKLPVNSNVVTVAEPIKGFFADINMDGKVDDLDFTEFKKQFRTGPDDTTYNPDYKFVDGSGSAVNAQDFARFAREYGRIGIE